MNKFFSLKINSFNSILKLVGVGLLLFGFSHAHAADLLANQKAVISDNFGSGSTVMYVAYLAEIFSAIALYVKSKNIMVFVGLVVILIFTTAGFALISGA